jgi:hypothetical protein
MAAFMDGPEPCATFGFARLFEVFSSAHFFFEAASFDQFAKAADRFLNGLFVPNN